MSVLGLCGIVVALGVLYVIGVGVYFTSTSQDKNN